MGYDSPTNSDFTAHDSMSFYINF